MNQSSSARTQILDAAVRVLREEGCAKLTQTRVARAAGLRQGHLTYYFPKKSALWVATAEWAHQTLMQELSDFLSSEEWKSCDDDSNRRCLVLMQHLVKDRQRAKLMLSLALQAEEEPAIAQGLKDAHAQTRRLLADAFSSEQPPAVLELVLSTLWGLGMRNMMLSPEEAERSSDELIQTLFQLLALNSSVGQLAPGMLRVARGTASPPVSESLVNSVATEEAM